MVPNQNKSTVALSCYYSQPSGYLKLMGTWQCGKWRMKPHLCDPIISTLRPDHVCLPPSFMASCRVKIAHTVHPQAFNIDDFERLRKEGVTTVTITIKSLFPSAARLSSNTVTVGVICDRAQTVGGTCQSKIHMNARAQGFPVENLWSSGFMLELVRVHTVSKSMPLLPVG